MARASHTLTELSGFCTQCHDLFTVEIKRIHKPGPAHMRYYKIETTPHLSYRKHVLYHRPKICDGVVKLFGQPRVAKYS
jgi:hypothetical protein